MEIFKWGLVLFSLVGVVLNNYKRPECFYIWAVTNCSWCIVNFAHGFIQQSLLFFTYFVLALHGLYKWKKGL